MIDAGMDVARIGLAHCTIDEAARRYHLVRNVAAETGKRVGVLVDLPGPRIRVADGGEAGFDLSEGQTVVLRPGNDRSTPEVIEVDYDQLLADLGPGDRLAFGSGTLVVSINDVDASSATATVVHEGEIRGRPGLHIPSDRLSLQTPTPDDLRMLDVFVEEGVDMVALSFVRSAHDLRRIGTEPHPRGPLVVAKIETRAAIENLAGIIEASAAIMVARGDLGTECEIAELPHLQKTIIRECIASGLPVITATQMLESMIHSPMPTRAEASDVANAVFDGSSAVMLSAETAIGQDPALVVHTMAELARRADEEFDHERWGQRLSELRLTGESDTAGSVTDAMTHAAWRAADELDISTLICISGSGFTVRSMARFRPKAKILGFSVDERTVQQLALSWGVTPYLLEHDGTYEDRVKRAVAQSRDAGWIRSGDLVAVLAGIDHQARTTDVLRVVRVP